MLQMSLLDIQVTSSRKAVSNWSQTKTSSLQSVIHPFRRFVNFEGGRDGEYRKQYLCRCRSLFPEHLQETMSKLPLEQRLYLDIFRPLDFY